MTNKEALTVLRIAYNDLFLHDLTDEEVEDCRDIGNNMVNEAIMEQSKRILKKYESNKNT